MNYRLLSLAQKCASLTLIATALLTIGACRKREPVQPVPPGLLDSEGRPIVPKPYQPPAASTEPTPEAPTVYDFERAPTNDPGSLSAKVPPSGLAPSNPPSGNANQDKELPPRDLAGELSALLSPASSCIDVAKAAALADGRLTISVSAYVQGTGHVSRATVTAPGQPASALSCIEKQVLALALRPPIADAPTQVKASTQVQVRMAGDAAAQPPAPNPSAIPVQPRSTDVAKPEPGDIAGPP